MDGRITKMEIKQTILLSASTNKLSSTHEGAECYATLIMEVLIKGCHQIWLPALQWRLYQFLRSFTWMGKSG